MYIYIYISMNTSTISSMAPACCQVSVSPPPGGVGRPGGSGGAAGARAGGEGLGGGLGGRSTKVWGFPWPWGYPNMDGFC